MNKIDKIDNKHLASIVIITILFCMIVYLWKTNETFNQPNTTSYLSNTITDSYNRINSNRFKTLDNQDRINNIETRMNKIKTDLASITPKKNSINNLNFY